MSRKKPAKQEELEHDIHKLKHQLKEEVERVATLAAILAKTGGCPKDQKYDKILGGIYRKCEKRLGYGCIMCWIHRADYLILKNAQDKEKKLCP